MSLSMDKLRIAMVAPPWYEVPPAGYGGIEQVVAELVERLIDRGHQVTLIGIRAEGSRAEVLSTYPTAQAERIGDPAVEAAHAAAADQLIADLRPDLVHDHTLTGPLLAGGREIPTVITAHGPVTDDVGMLFASLGDSIRLVALSEAQIRPRPDLPWAGVVHNAVATDQFPFRAEKDDYALFLGRCNPTKGVHLAIDAARAAGRRLVLAMKCNEPAEQEYFDAEVQPRLGPDTEYVGEAGGEEKLALLAGARCLLFPIRWEEPFGMVAIEAMACGTPVVGFRRGALPEIVAEGVTGVLVSDPDELPAAIAHADTFSPAACRERVETSFSGARMAADYERIYRAVLADHGARHAAAG
jgi:glycosyltransferase involved in cell wall biosynthesis